MLAGRAAHKALRIDSCFRLLVSYFHAHIIATQQKITRTKCVIKSENSSCFLARGVLHVPCQKCQGENLKSNYYICLICYYIKRYLLLYLTLFISKEKRRDPKTSPLPLAYYLIFYYPLIIPITMTFTAIIPVMINNVSIIHLASPVYFVSLTFARQYSPHYP
jgi:hypothetical protein